MKTGWVCPRCEKVHAPSVLKCTCKPSTVTIGPPKSPPRVERAKYPPGTPPRIVYVGQHFHGPRIA